MANWFVGEVVKACAEPGFSPEDIDRIPHIATAGEYSRVMSRATVQTSGGLCLADAGIIQRTEVRRILFVLESELEQYDKFVEQYLLEPGSAVVPLGIGVSTKAEIERLFRTMLREDNKDAQWLADFATVEWSRITCSQDALNIARKKGRVPKYVFDEWSVSDINGGAVIKWKKGLEPKGAAAYELPKHSVFMAEKFVSMKASLHRSPLSEAWLERFPGSPFLPAN